MRKWLMPLVLGALLVGCAGSRVYTASIDDLKNACTCPGQTVVIGVESPLGIMYVPIPEGSLDEPKNYLTEEQFKELIEQGAIDRIPRNENL